MNDMVFSEIENKIGYVFKNKKLLKIALTHPSYESTENYERLEFLGDAVLELTISRMLFDQNPKLSEGELTKLRASIVCSKSLANTAKRLDLGRYIFIGKGEEKTGGRQKISILENVMESLIGAVFLDGGYEVSSFVIKKIFSFEKADKEVDYKSVLQERIQKGGCNSIEYRLNKSEGPPHNCTFYIDLYIGGKKVGSGVGRSKKKAEQYAAMSALKNI